MSDDNFGRTVINPDTRICEVLAGLAGHFRKTWCCPSQEKLLELLRRFTGRVMSRRTLNRHLAGLERDLHIRRIRRHRRERGKGFTMHSTVYVIKARFLQRMKRVNTALVRFAELAAPGGQSRSNIRVPSSAQYARDLLSLAYKGGTYPQAGAP